MSEKGNFVTFKTGKINWHAICQYHHQKSLKLKNEFRAI